MKRSLSKIIMILALGAVMTMPGIISCKKDKSNEFSSYPGPGYSNQGNTPLPSTLLLLGSGLAGLGLVGWGKRKKP